MLNLHLATEPLDRKHLSWIQTWAFYGLPQVDPVLQTPVR